MIDLENKVFLDTDGEMTFENKERLNFIMHFLKKGADKSVVETKNGTFVREDAETSFNEIWLPCAERKQAEIDDLKAQLKAVHESRIEFVEYCRKVESGDFVLVEKKHTEDWYLDDSESMWMDEPDSWLSDLDIGEVQSVEHKEYLITESDTLYAAKVWDDANDQVGFWEFFKTEEEAVKAALYCKAKFNDEGE